MTISELALLSDSLPSSISFALMVAPLSSSSFPYYHIYNHHHRYHHCHNHQTQAPAQSLCLQMLQVLGLFSRVRVILFVVILFEFYKYRIRSKSDDEMNRLVYIMLEMVTMFSEILIYISEGPHLSSLGQSESRLSENLQFLTKWWGEELS